MTATEVHEQIRELKQHFHAMMNGALSASMREKGLTYKVNFGVEYPRLIELAKSMPKDHDLAQALWKEDIRECRILAPMLQPVETFYPEIADIWVDSMRFSEEVEMTAMHLLQYLPYASDLAFRWIAGDKPVAQACGYHILARLFGRGLVCNDRSAKEYLDQAAADIISVQAMVRKAAFVSLTKYALLGEKQAEDAEQLLQVFGGDSHQ